MRGIWKDGGKDIPSSFISELYFQMTVIKMHIPPATFRVPETANGLQRTFLPSVPMESFLSAKTMETFPGNPRMLAASRRC